jgi:hypothetical protein
MSIDFPSSPAVDQVHSSGAVSWRWDGEKWVAVSDVGDVVGPASSTTGHLATYADATGKLLADGAIAAAAVLLSGGALGTPASGNASNLTNIPLGAGTGVVGASHGGAGTVNGLLKADGAGNVSAATGGTDYALPGVGTVPNGTATYDQLVWNGSAWTVQRPKYVFGFNVPGVLALNTVFSHVFSKAVTIPANFGAYLGHSTQVRGSANATSSPVVTVAKATAGSPLSYSTIGTITITAGGVVPVLATSGGAALNFAQGDIARFTCTTGDTTFADLVATVVGFEA